MEESALKKRALSRYGSCAAFARAMGWGTGKAGRILNGRQSAGPEDIRAMAEKLALGHREIVELFFGTMFTTRTNGQGGDPGAGG